jgi:hypothetical protein
VKDLEQYCNCVLLLFLFTVHNVNGTVITLINLEHFLFYFQVNKLQGNVTKVTDTTFTVKWDITAIETTYDITDDNTFEII